MSSPSDIVIMLDDAELIRLVSSWPKIKDRSDTKHIATVANILQRNIEEVIERARAHGLIFDDGTVNEFAQKYINGIVASHLKRLNAVR